MKGFQGITAENMWHLAREYVMVIELCILIVGGRTYTILFKVLVFDFNILNSCYFLFTLLYWFHSKSYMLLSWLQLLYSKQMIIKNDNNFNNFIKLLSSLKVDTLMLIN